MFMSYNMFMKGVFPSEKARQDIMRIDARGLKCPEPVMLLHNALANIPPDSLIIMDATDPTTVRDVRDFCRHLGHQLLEFSEEAEGFCYKIRKADKTKRQDKPTNN